MSENCYIYWDNEEIPEEDRYMYFQCEACHAKNGLGILWRKEFGYGKWNVTCCNCDKEIHRAKRKKTDEDTKDTSAI